MELFDLEELARTRGVKEEVERAVELVRQVEQLGGKRFEYNLVRPFSRLQPLTRGGDTPGVADPRTVRLKPPRR
jgi:hypothetical protein